MEMGRLLARRRGARIVGEPICVSVGLQFPQWYYNRLCDPAERSLKNGKNNVLNSVLDRSRLTDAGNFCTCDECTVINGIPASYAYCCKEVVDAESECALNVARRGEALLCLTKHSSFDSVCLDVEVLNILSTHVGVCAEWPGPFDSFTNREYRYMAYRAFTFWVHGDDSRGNTLEPPLCVLNRIVQAFPMEENEQGNPTQYAQRGLLNLFGEDFFSAYVAQ